REMDAPVLVTIAAALGGGIFGDHCSPISDTTILSSMASACDHIDHVRTQLPYALLAGGIAALCYLVTGIAGLG
ncbi:MAG: tetracycline resistance efflux pump, partial [Flavobacteriales bacterium]